MLKKRIIPCLDIKNGRTVKGVNFLELKDMGDPIKLASRYVIEGADEIIFLDISATTENRKTLLDLVKQISKEINIPFTVGGGISSIDQVEDLLTAGADKISINSAAISNPSLIYDIASAFGSQFVVVAVDTQIVADEHRVFSHGGRKSTEKKTIPWCHEIVDRGAGEILLTSIDADGTKNGFDLNIIKEISSQINIPLIASGGAGQKEHFSALFQSTEASAGLAASIFHSKQLSIPILKQHLIQNKIPTRCN